MKHLRFTNGDELPILGLGTWKAKPGEAKKAVKMAVEMGYRHFDCAPIYGNEQEIGEALAACLQSGKVKREDLWISSKLWNDSHKKTEVIPALNKTLENLQLDYLDLFLIHWPVALKHGTKMPRGAQDFLALEKVPLVETWRGMEETLSTRKAKHIGVSNFSEKKLSLLIPQCRKPPEVNQVELHPFLQQNALLKYCQSLNIQLVAYSPLGSKDRPQRLKSEDEPLLLENKTVRHLARKKGCTPAQILIAFGIARNTAVIPKATSEKHLKSNFEATQIHLDESEMEQLRKQERAFRYVDGSMWENNGGPYTTSEIWDEPAP